MAICFIIIKKKSLRFAGFFIYSQQGINVRRYTHENLKAKTEAVIYNTSCFAFLHKRQKKTKALQKKCFFLGWLTGFEPATLRATT